MGVGKADSHVRQALHVRGVELDLVGIAGEVLIRAGISHSHVISHHQDDVGLRGGATQGGNRGESKNRRKEDGWSAHYSNTLSS